MDAAPRRQRKMRCGFADVADASLKLLVHSHGQPRSARQHLTQLTDAIAGSMQDHKHDSGQIGRKRLEQVQ